MKRWRVVYTVHLPMLIRDRCCNITDLENREQRLMKSVLVINLDVKDSHGEAANGAKLVLDLCRKVSFSRITYFTLSPFCKTCNFGTKMCLEHAESCKLGRGVFVWEFSWPTFGCLLQLFAFKICFLKPILPRTKQ